MNPQEKKALDDIDQSGCHVLSVLEEDDLPGFSYSIGIAKTSQAPEIIIYGLKPELRQYLINEYNRRVRDGDEFATGQFYADFLDGVAVTFIEVEAKHYKEHFGWGRWLYKDYEFKVLQLIWPTTDGLWPWDKSASDYYLWAQPILNQTGTMDQI